MLLTVVGDILDSDIYVHPLKLAGNLRKEHRIYRAQPALSRGYGKIGKARRSVELSGEIEGPDIHPRGILEVQDSFVAADEGPFNQPPVPQPHLGIRVAEGGQDGEALERLYGEIHLPGIGV